LDVETAFNGHGEPILTRAGKRLREVAATLRIGPPAAKLYAVDPVEDATMRASAE
jgi:hypothetical protein